MEKIVQDLLQHARATWRRRWWILPVAWLVCLGGWAYVHSLPDVYESESRVFVNTQSVLDPLLRGMTVRPDTEQSLRMITSTLLSRDNLEQIARDSDLDVLTGISDLDEHVEKLRAGLNLAGGQRNNIYRISFRHHNPDVAHHVVRETVNLFMERGMGDSRLDITTSQQFIERQMEGYESQLQEQEAKIEQFKRDNARFLSGDGNFYSRLERARERLSQTQLQEREALSRLQILERRAAEASGPEAVARYQNPELDRRINDLQERIDTMRQQFTDDHPDVVSARRILGELEERREREAEAFAENPQALEGVGASTTDPLQHAITETESELASLRTRIQDFEERVATLERDVDRAPAVESELTALTRNYDVLRDSYRQLQNRREQVVMSGEVERQTDSVDFRVLEPPRRPMEPASPDRPLLATGVLLLGLGAGTGFAFLLSQMRRTVGDSRQLAEITGRPVLGTVSRVRTPVQTRRRFSELLFFTMGIGSLLVVFATVMALYLTGSAYILDELIRLLR
ncbi:XrtA system polysaccharide chain length determinant [Thioalkalivibrio sp. ALJT]|uniref:XrtA system polysaccharide chain length determinant n=1 Tax=Thioalkalivibrio sp. ALJT TaxID=1158146 RepID=UPI00037A34BE|nr:XrtA system polysaccharide chain length determinant [Thioalkalivibrio sp. ALJT]